MILAKEINDIKKYISISNNFKIELLNPSAEEQKKYLIEVLGITEFNNLVNTFGDDSQELTANQKKLLPYAQKALFNLTLAHYMDLGDIEINSSGIQIITSEDRKTAFQWQILKAKRNFIRTGFNALEELLYFLWNSDDGDYPDWEASDEMKNYLSFFCNSGRDFHKYYNIRESFALYREMRDTIQLVEDKYLLPTLGEDLFNEIKAQILAFTLTEDNKKLLVYINRALTYKTVFHAMPKLVSFIDEMGIYENFDSPRLTQDAKDKVRNEFVSYRVREADREGESNIKSLKNFLADNAAYYPLYVVPAAGSTNINDKDRGIYAFM